MTDGELLFARAMNACDGEKVFGETFEMEEEENEAKVGVEEVLDLSDIPSILVEVGFISNPQEEKNLNWSKYRERLATAMFNATKRYFKQVPPDGTLWAQEREYNRTHRVRSGESLSLLAQRYNVKVSSIKAANDLSSDVVRVGQVLNIPRT